MTRASDKAKVLVLCPHPEETGGVSNYYSLVNKHFRSDAVSLTFLYTGRHSAGRGVSRYFHPLVDLVSLVKRLPRHDLVVLNPSLDPKSILRDGVFNLLARSSGRKTVVFFRGWSPRWEQVIERHIPRLFGRVFSADRVVILCSRFAESLAGWGIPPASIVLETTTYEHHECDLPKHPAKLVFLSRFAQGKGCLEAVRTLELLLPDFPALMLYMVGEGELMPELLDYVKEHGLAEHVQFTGWLSGERKYRLLAECGIMLYPTDYGEGMPNCLVEGMGMGLALVSRPVAGICDMVREGENGFLVSTMEPRDFAAKVRYLLEHRDVWRSISERNRQLGRERFAITSVVARLESLYLDCCGRWEVNK